MAADEPPRPSHLVELTLIQAWNDLLAAWELKSPTTCADKVHAVFQHYQTEQGISTLPPSLLILEWREDGTPEPTAWVKAKARSILREQRART